MFDEFGIYDLSVFDDHNRDIIADNKLLSELEREARKSIKNGNCYLCPNTCSSFCKSHSLPRFVLKNIASNGHIYDSNLFIQSQQMKEKYGVENAGVFFLICNKCDKEVFSEYESEAHYNIKPTQKMLAQIAIKTYLKWIYKEKINFEMYDGLIKRKYTHILRNSLSSGEKMILAQLEYNKNMRKLCLMDYEKCFNYAKSYLDKGIDKDTYDLIFFHKLDYVVPVAFQGWIGLICDFQGNIINDSGSENLEHKLNSFHVCVFPLNGFTSIFLFKKKTNKKLKNFFVDFNKLNLQKKLQLISYILFLYSEELYINKRLKESLDESEICFIKSIAGKTNSYSSDCKPGLRKSFDLSKYLQMPNVLSEKYKTN